MSNPSHETQAVTSRATLDDLDALATLFDGYRVFYKQPSDPARACAFIEERLRRDESVIFIARDRGNREALGFTQLYPMFSSVAARRIWVLNDLFVAPAARQRGVARALMDRARDFATEAGALRLILETAEDNHAAQALYESLGYVRESGERHYSLELG
ncbi:MAG TPA: GNAT family N-acetyltransferase [Rhodanobacteraceae bacterium]|jgi:ribosomal protein S18 acetylase RimI-like enzyme|nr:GNAT family N-acetyltransferase [Rhodanobacteraceae bacterium]